MFPSNNQYQNQPQTDNQSDQTLPYPVNPPINNPDPTFANNYYASLPGTAPVPPTNNLNLNTQNQPQTDSNNNNVVNDTPKISVPETANDTDLIEKEWVIKAQSIVNKTIDDPYKQSRELTALKAEYIKKRYNKDIKVVE